MSRMARLFRWILPGFVTAAASACLGGLHYLLRVFPRFDYGAHPAGVGAAGRDWELKSCDGVPYLEQQGLPYPTDFDTTNRERQPLGGRWLMRLDPEDLGLAQHWENLTAAGEGWEPIDIPSTFNAALSRDPNYLGPAWFCLRFVPTLAADEGHWLRLCLEGVLIRSTVWVNGQRVSSHEGGWTPQYADVSRVIVPGAENTLVVRSDNRLTPTSLPTRLWDHHLPGWHAYAGIFRDVYLERLPETYIFKAAYTCVLEEGRARLNLDVLVAQRTGAPVGEYPRLRVALCPPDAPKGKRGHVAKSQAHKQALSTGASAAHVRDGICHYTLSFAIDAPELWAPASPKLYEVTLILGGDEVAFQAGLRTIAVRGTDILLNGERVFLKGIAKHEDHPSLGAGQTQALVEQDLGLIQAMGANYVRFAHYPHHTAELRKARDLGLMLAEEIPLYQSGTGFIGWYGDKMPLKTIPWREFGNKQLLAPALLLNAQGQLAQMIERDRLNPAIIIWGVANETYTLGEAAARAHGWLADTVRALDPSRPVTMAELTTDVRLIDDRRRASKYMDIVSVNIYNGWYYGKMEDVRAHLERLHACFPDKPVIISECGAEAAPGRRDSDGVWIAERVPPGKTYSEDYQERLLEHYVRYAIKTPFIAGISPWVYADFFCPEFPSNPVPYYNSKGIVSKDRQPKKSYYMLQRIYHAGL